MTVTLAVTKREGSAAKVRAAGMIPAVVYGPKQEPVSISVERRAFDKMYQEAGESTIITLTGLEGEIEALVKDVAFDPAKGGPIHVDFYAFERGKEITTNVPLHFIGEAPVEKLGATVNKVLHEVEVTCRPSALPSHLDVDIAGLADTEALIAIKDLVVPKGVTLEHDPEEVVANVAEARAEEPETTEALDMSAIEVEKKGKVEEDAA